MAGQPPVNLDYLKKSKEYLENQLKVSIAYGPTTRLAVTTQVIDAQQHFTGLGAVIQKRAADGSNSTGGRQLEIIVMDGTIAINYKNTWYYIPVSIRLPQGFPDSVPPMCYVTPTDNLVLKPSHPVVDSTGLCSLPGFRAGEWQSGRSNLKAAIEEMARQFTLNPPLYSASAASKPVPTPDGPAPTSTVPLRPSPSESLRPSPQSTTGSFFPGVVTPSSLRRQPTQPQVAHLSPAEERALADVMAAMGLSAMTSNNMTAIQTQADMLMAQDVSIEDIIDNAGEQLRSDKINLETYLKTVRDMSFSQFLIRAKLMKLQPALSATDKKLREIESRQAFAAEQARWREEEEKKKREAEEAAREAARQQKEEQERLRREAEEAVRKQKEEAEQRRREEAARAAAAEAARRKAEEDLRKKQEEDLQARRRWEAEQAKLRQQHATQVRPPGPTPYSPYGVHHGQAAPYGGTPAPQPYYQPSVPPPGPSTGPSYQNPGGGPAPYQPPSYTPAGYGQPPPNPYMTGTQFNPSQPPPYPPPPPPGSGPVVYSAYTGQPSNMQGQQQQAPYYPPLGPLGALGNFWNKLNR